METLIRRYSALTGIILACLPPSWALAAEKFTLATYNLENYLEAIAETRPAKAPDARAKIRECLRALHADVLALQEMGGTNALLELRASLKAEGLEYPHWEHITGSDPHIHVALLSRFPIVARRPHTNEGFLLDGRRFKVSRGFAEVDIRVNPRYSFTLFVAHLKSRRAVPHADEAELREQEALILREKIDARLRANPNLNLAVVGDLNDVYNSPSTKAILGRRNRLALFDTRPAEKNGDPVPNSNPAFSPRNITWTYFHGQDDTYSRIDFILLSRGMAREWDAGGTYVLSLPNWGLASDHRPVIASFLAEDR